jgi:hypothetical protein
MDKLAQRLRDDADKIETRVSPELDERIRASLQGISPQPARPSAPPARPISMWWASSITGVAAAIAMIVIFNSQQPEPELITEPSKAPPAMPFLDWNAQTAILTSPLRKEYEDLQADLKKAEKALKDDIGL